MKNWEKETIEKLKKLPGKISFYYRSLDSEDTAEYQADQPLMADGAGGRDDRIE